MPFGGDLALSPRGGGIIWPGVNEGGPSACHAGRGGRPTPFKLFGGGDMALSPRGGGMICPGAKEEGPFWSGPCRCGKSGADMNGMFCPGE